MEVYIDDIMVKSKTRGEHALHLEETFCLMRVYNMKLNLTKCAFEVSAGKFIGFMVTLWGIKLNSNKIKVVMQTPTPSNKNELQCLTGHLATLEHFIARFTDKIRPFFLTLRGANLPDG